MNSISSIYKAQTYLIHTPPNDGLLPWQCMLIYGNHNKSQLVFHIGSTVIEYGWRNKHHTAADRLKSFNTWFGPVLRSVHTTIEMKKLENVADSDQMRVHVQMISTSDGMSNSFIPDSEYSGDLVIISCHQFIYDRRLYSNGGLTMESKTVGYHVLFKMHVNNHRADLVIISCPATF